MKECSSRKSSFSILVVIFTSIYCIKNGGRIVIWPLMVKNGKKNGDFLFT